MKLIFLLQLPGKLHSFILQILAGNEFTSTVFLKIVETPKFKHFY